MYTIVLYAMLCTSPTSCDEYQPASWTVHGTSTVSNEQEEQLAFEGCASLEREYMKKRGYKESDCYYAE